MWVCGDWCQGVRLPASTGLARALNDYMLYVDHNPKRALELCSQCTKLSDYRDWWWKERLGKCYFQLGMFRDAEKQFLSSQKNCGTVLATLDLCKVRCNP